MAGYFGIIKPPHLHASAHNKPNSKPLTALQIQSLGSQIQTIINNNPSVDLSVSVDDLDNNSLQQYGDNSSFVAASTTKLLTAGEFLQEVEHGNQTLSEDVGGETAHTALQAMIVQSDDTAWQLLTDQMGDSALADYATQVGINDFNIDDNSLTSSDMALFLQKLYQGQLLNQSDTKLLLSYMQRANYKDYIVAAVPTGITVYHKVGLIDDNVHDASIIDNGKHPYVLVIFSNGNGTYDDIQRAQIFQQITKDTLDSFN